MTSIGLTSQGFGWGFRAKDVDQLHLLIKKNKLIPYEKQSQFMENNLRSMVVKEARAWVGTPFLHQGRRKKIPVQKGGCDCLGLIIGISKACGINSRLTSAPLYKADNTHYNTTVSCHLLIGALDAHLVAKQAHADLQHGDILLMKVLNQPKHLGIFADDRGYQTIIHAYSSVGFVSEHIFDAKWQQRVHKKYFYHF